MDFVPISSMGSVVFRFGSRRSFFSLSYRLSYSGGSESGRLLVPFVAPHVLIASVILAIAGRSLVHELCSPW